MSELGWRKSSHSDSGGGECVEVAAARGAVHVRDSKDIEGSQLCLTSGSWNRFVASLQVREVDHRA